MTQGHLTCRGEIVENVSPPLPLDTPLLLVKPQVGLSTPEIFKALDLSKCSKADPRHLMQQMADAGRMTQEVCVNDLEQPAFDRSASNSGSVCSLPSGCKAWQCILFLVCKFAATQLKVWLWLV